MNNDRVDWKVNVPICTDIESKVREIITYHSADGTSGYLLSENQIAKILSLIEEREKEVIRNSKTVRAR